MRAPTISDSLTQNKISIDNVEVRLVRLPLKEPFETSFGSIESRLIFLVRIAADGVEGWGEVVAAEEPLYSYETVGTAFHIIRDFLGPALIAKPVTSLSNVADRFATFRGHNMAKAGLELAYMDLMAHLTNQSLSELLGGTRQRVPVGVSLGIQPSPKALLQRVVLFLSLDTGESNSRSSWAGMLRW